MAVDRPRDAAARCLMHGHAILFSADGSILAVMRRTFLGDVAGLEVSLTLEGFVRAKLRRVIKQVGESQYHVTIHADAKRRHMFQAQSALWSAPPDAFDAMQTSDAYVFEREER